MWVVLRIAYCVFGVEDGDGEGAEELDDGEERGEGQVELPDGLEVNFRFEGGELRVAQEENHAEGCEVKEEDEERGGEDGGAKKRQGHVQPHAERVGAEGAGGLIKFRVEVGKRGSNNADDDGGVVKNVSEEDSGERVKEEG
ncbi:MAG: hypothetical protein CNIPEHKO_03061 [Anaerolineales bacterium]|nr:hypothetical protein [Anaerolineales bacterium]